MRLLNVQTLELENFVCTDKDLPDYTILSHTWGHEEVSFQDLTSRGDNLENLAGYDKIRQCCAKSACKGFEYTWIDTCCIDKSSSAELSEAINSMFKWYSRAEVCYAYLSDVGGTGHDGPGEPSSSFRRSRWFTRGWTLQELLAPVEVVFLNKHWVEIGTKRSLASVITSFTRIDAGALEKPLCGSEHVPHRCRGYSIAQKLCWAAHRETTREEDRAYCLMGLFDVNMPLLYGEGGQKAFARLQSQIMKQSSDDSIFAWSIPPWEGDEDNRHAYIAPSPSSFCIGAPIFNAASSEGPEQADGFRGGTPSTQLRPILTSYEETKDSLLLTAPILNFEDAPLIDGGTIFALEQTRLHHPRYGGRARMTVFIRRGANAILDSNDWIIAILGCRSQHGHVGIVLRDQKDGTYTREPHLRESEYGTTYVTQIVGLQIRHLPQPQRLRIRQGGSVDSRCVRGHSSTPDRTRSLAITLVESGGYAMARWHGWDRVRHFPGPAKTDAFGTAIVKDVFTEGVTLMFGSVRPPGPRDKHFRLALLYSPSDGVVSQSNPHLALAFDWAPGASPLMVRGFIVASEDVASGQWEEVLDSQLVEWTEAETGRYVLTENKYLDLRFRKAPVGNLKRQESWYLFVSIKKGRSV